MKHRTPEGILWPFAEILHALSLEHSRFLKATPVHVLFPVLSTRSCLTSNPNLTDPVPFGAGGIERSNGSKSGDHGGRDVEPALIMIRVINKYPDLNNAILSPLF
jgi:hypothetical protein